MKMKCETKQRLQWQLEDEQRLYSDLKSKILLAAISAGVDLETEPDEVLDSYQWMLDQMVAKSVQLKSLEEKYAQKDKEHTEDLDGFDDYRDNAERYVSELIAKHDRLRLFIASLDDIAHNTDGSTESAVKALDLIKEELVNEESEEDAELMIEEEKLRALRYAVGVFSVEYRQAGVSNASADQAFEKLMKKFEGLR